MVPTYPKLGRTVVLLWIYSGYEVSVLVPPAQIAAPAEDPDEVAVAQRALAC
jgi:hypothetical protein